MYDPLPMQKIDRLERISRYLLNHAGRKDAVRRASVFSQVEEVLTKKLVYVYQVLAVRTLEPEAVERYQEKGASVRGREELENVKLVEQVRGV